MRFSVLALVIALLLLTSGARAAPPVVLFDQGHGQRFVVEQTGELHLSGLADAFRQAGFEVRSSRSKLTSEVLSGVSTLVISGLFVAYDAQEVQAILSFLEQGGALSVMLHVAPTVTNLLDALGLVSSPGVLNEGEDTLDGSPLNFRATRLSAHPLTEGLQQISLYGAWALTAKDREAQTIATTGPQSWIDFDQDGQRGPNEPLHAYGVAVAGTRGKGRFAAFGDDAIFQNRFLHDDNRKLAENLARWLRGAVQI